MKTLQPLLRQFCCLCRDDAVCPNRHVFLPHLDQSELPASGPVEVSTSTSQISGSVCVSAAQSCMTAPPPHPLQLRCVPQVLPLHVKTASVFCGRIVQQDDAAFREMAAEMTAFYSDNKPVAKELVEGRLYAVLLEEEVHR